jgi:hypothetical protein
MRYAHDCGAHRRSRFENLTPGLSGLLRVVIGPHTKLGVFSLDRRVDHVAGDQCILARSADEHRMLNSMTGGGKEPHRTGRPFGCTTLA